MPNNLDWVNHAWLGLGDIRTVVRANPLMRRPTQYIGEPFGLYILRLMRNPDYIHFAVKTLFDINLLPEQSAVLAELWTHPFPMFVGSRGFGKSWLLAVYATLRCILYPGTKIVIVGSGFRQAKIIFEYMETIWRNAPILRDICDSRSGPKRDVDRCTMQLNTSWAIAVPLGDGSKIRGLRAHIVLADEFACLDRESLIETKDGLIRIGYNDNIDVDLYTGDSNKTYEKPSKYIITPLTDVYEIKLRNGYIIRCSENHKVMTQDGWKKPLELTNKDWIESANKYIFPDNQVNELDEKLAWLIGILTSEGCISNLNGTMSIKTTDKNLAEFIKKEFGFHIYERNSYIDKRGWNCKKSYDVYLCDIKLRRKLELLGLEYRTAIDKKIPWSILRSPRHIVLSFLEGLFEGDGSCFLFKDKKRDNNIGVAYYSVSETLCRDVHILLDKLGFDGYINYRKSNLSDNKQWFVRLNSNTAYDFASLLNIERFQNALNNYYKQPENTYVSWDKDRNKWHAQYKYLGKIIQQRFIDKKQAIEYIKELKSKPRFRKVINVIKLDKQQHLYDYYLPVTHSFYANGCRNHNSIPPDIYETVVAGFAAVSADPVSNVIEAARRKELAKLGVWTSDAELKYSQRQQNQAIISGTADYGFKPFAKYWKRYCDIINSKGDPRILCEILDMEELPQGFSYKDYSVIRVPYELIPEGFMDEKQVIRAKATITTGIYQMEYGACFPADSEGFFKRSLIESCVATPEKPIKLPSGEVWFDVMLHGDRKHEYILAADPASERDNFSLVILEKHPDHSRIVYAWSTNRKDFKVRLKSGLVNKDDFYGFCARKMRDLMKAFNIVAITIDGQGGGVAVEEALHDSDKMESGELPIWPIIEDDDPKDTDDKPGLHILHICQFSRADWTAGANHGLRKDLEDKVLIFPRYDPVSLGLAFEEDNLRKVAFESNHPDKKFNIYDTLEDCVVEIEELKTELSTIVMTQTSAGVGARDRWDTPEVKLPGGKKGRLKKDRYSALVMANSVAREYIRRDIPPEYNMIGDFAGNLVTKSHNNEQSYYGPEWFVKGMEGVLDVNF